MGLAAEAAPNRPVKSGLHRMAGSHDRRELALRSLPEAAAIRAIATHLWYADAVYATRCV